MKQYFTDKNGTWIEDNFTVGETYGSGRVVVLKRGERQANGSTTVVFADTETGLIEKVSTDPHTSVYWTQDNCRYESIYVMMLGGVVKSNNPNYFALSR
tara:strand:- start:363 stop:659 length:297 start_codon:yes stop_codon:yes gene_type:complete